MCVSVCACVCVCVCVQANVRHVCKSQALIIGGERVTSTGPNEAVNPANFCFDNN